MSQMIWSGSSWSGREKHCAYLNCGDGTFANVSAALGVDYADDARALAVSDWDGDGDLDLWIKNRTGPQLRFLRNEGDGGHFLSLELRGRACNREAIGARVAVNVGGRTLVQTVRAGSGYLAQSALRLHFGLGSATTIDRVSVRWPGGEEEMISGLKVDGRYRYTQGEDHPTGLPSRSLSFDPPVTNLSTPLAGRRTILRQPFPLPHGAVSANETKRGVTLITFWANWCANCQTELTEFTARNDELAAAGIRIVPISVDKREDEAKARAVATRIKMPYAVRFMSDSEQVLYTAVLRNVLDIHAAMSIPLSMLVDRKGAVQIIYTASVSVGQLLADARAFGGDSNVPKRDRAPYVGRWYASASRSYADMVRSLKEAKLRNWARFYLKLDRAARHR